MVFHLAANSDIRAGNESTDRDLKLTFLLTYNVLECMRLYGVEKIMFTSSPAIFGSHDTPLTEDLAIRPESLYGASKAASELYIRAFASLFGTRAWILRLSNMIGKSGWKGDVPFYSHNSKKLNELGWSPKLTSREAMAKSIKEMVNN